MFPTARGYKYGLHSCTRSRGSHRKPTVSNILEQVHLESPSSCIYMIDAPLFWEIESLCDILQLVEFGNEAIVDAEGPLDRGRDKRELRTDGWERFSFVWR